MKLRFDEENHAYYLDGKRVKGVTTAAKIPLDTYKLELHMKRMVACGLARRPDLVEQVAAHIGDDKVLDRLCDAAEKAARADAGSRRGTAVHRITDRIDGGEEIIPTALAAHVQATWDELWAASGLEVIPEYMERIIVYPEARICGKLDRIGRTRKGVLVVCDTKTGKWELAFPHSAAAQLALYANAPLLAAPLDRHGETTDFEPMPEVDKKWGVLIHMPEEGEHQTVKLNIEKGWEAVTRTILPSIEWRNVRSRDLVFPLAKVEPKTWLPPEEGDEVAESDVAALRDEFKRCEGKAAVDVWIKQSVEAGRSFNIAGPGCTPTVRRFEIIRAAIAWSVHEEDVLRAALGWVMAEEVQPAVTVGMALGSLTLAEAQSLAILADDLDAARIALTFAEDGKPVLSDAQPLPAA